MIKNRSLLRNEAGTAVIEIAIALPVLVLMIWGIFQVGIAFQASAGMQNALGEGARMATLFPAPTNDDIKTRIKAKAFGVGIGQFSEPVVTNECEASGANACATGTTSTFKDLSVTFTMTPNLLFFNGPPIALTRSKRVYTAS